MLINEPNLVPGWTDELLTTPPRPDPPEREPDDMTNFNHLTITGNAHLPAEHLGNRYTTLVTSEHWVSAALVQSAADVRYPDLLVAFGWIRG